MHLNARRCVLLVVSVVAAVPGSPAHARAPGVTVASLASGGEQAKAWSARPSVSADGRFVAFESRAANLVPDDTNGMADIFVRDRVEGVTERVSLRSDGSEMRPRLYGAARPDISADGRYVAFDSEEGLLLRDRVAGTTASLSTSWTPVWGLSTGGRHLVTGGSDAIVHDLVTGTRRSAFLDGSDAPMIGQATDVAVSADGTRVAFVTDVWFNSPGLFVRDLPNGTTTRIILPETADRIMHLGISDDGSTVAFSASGGNTGLAAFVHVEGQPVARRIHSGAAMTSISGDGTVVAFSARTIGPEDVNFENDTFAHNVVHRYTERVSTSWYGGEADGPSFWPAVSADGGSIAFQSAATDLFLGDTNGMTDIFVREKWICPDGERADGTVSRHAAHAAQRLGPAESLPYEAGCEHVVGRGL